MAQEISGGVLVDEKGAKRKTDETMQCAQRTCSGTGAGSGAEQFEAPAWHAPNMLDELRLLKDGIRAEVGILVHDGGWCTDSQGDIEDLVEEMVRTVSAREHVGLRFPGGRVLFDGGDIMAVMTDS
jgi:hypothetical protein